MLHCIIKHHPFIPFAGCKGSQSSLRIRKGQAVNRLEQFLPPLESKYNDCSGLTSVTIGNSVEYIGSEAFLDCSDLLDVYCYAERVPSTYSDAFEGSYPKMPLFMFLLLLLRAIR